MFRDFGLFERIGWYTRTGPDQAVLRRDWDRRNDLLAVARDCEALAAAWQSLADSIREAATA